MCSMFAKYNDNIQKKKEKNNTVRSMQGQLYRHKMQTSYMFKMWEKLN